MHPAPPPPSPSQGLDVLLLGWADGSLAHLAKYKALYPPEGDGPKDTAFHLETSRTADVRTEPLDLGRARRAKLHAFLRERGHIVKDGEIPTGGKRRRPLVVHVFSNGGVQTLSSVLALAESRGERVLPASLLIVDSAPTTTAGKSLWAGADLFALPLGLGGAGHAVVRGALYLALVAHHTLFARVLGYRPLMNRNRDMLQYHPALVGASKLFLYSATDRFINAEHLEWLLDRMRRQVQADAGGDAFATVTEHSAAQTVSVSRPALDKGPAVVPEKKEEVGRIVAVKFPLGSAHVAHFRQYPREYAAAVHGMLAKL
ncbi:hypothetical protein H9P43_003936 [Blastocladiella emersonii ATCC 22665]|nr:hypothetical protein H9P43_003936 [Blastocladiella emersonii ATCC 22665]